MCVFHLLEVALGLNCMPMSYPRSEVDLFEFFIFCMIKHCVMVHMTVLADTKFSIYIIPCIRE